MRLRFSIDDHEQVLPLEGDEVRLGRGSENDVVLPDFSVSRQHAALRQEEGVWFIYDLDSTNGIQLNRTPIRRGAVRPGDQLKVGVFDLTVEGDGEVLSARPEPIVSGDASPISNATIVRQLSDFSAEFGITSAVPTHPGESLDTAAPEARESVNVSHFFGYLTRLARDLIKSDSMEEVLQRVMEIAFDALPVERGFIILGNNAEEATCELKRVGDAVELRPEGEVPVSWTILRTVMEQQVALLTLDALDDQRLVGGESIRIHGIRAAMCAPLWSEDRITGFIQVDSPFHRGRFTDEHLDFLIALANYAAVGVERVIERRVRGRLERYHSPAVIEEVLKEDERAAGHEERHLKKAIVTVLFADLVGFTAFSETADLDDVAELLRGYCTRSVEAIFQQGGTLDKFIGDCVMAFFGAPMAQPDHALRGVRAAIQIQDSVDEWNVDRRRRGLPDVRCRVAVNSGQVMVGDVGSERRVDYTVLGNTVNVAARLEEKVAEPGSVVIGSTTWDEIQRLGADGIEVEALGAFALKGLQQQVPAYRVVRHSRTT